MVELQAMRLDYLIDVSEITNAMIPIVRLLNTLYIPGKVTHRPPVLDDAQLQKVGVQFNLWNFSFKNVSEWM